MQIEHSDFHDQIVRGLSHRMSDILSSFDGEVGSLIADKNLEQATVEALVKIQQRAAAASELMDRTHSLLRPSRMVWREIDLGDLVRQLRPEFEALGRNPLSINAPHGIATVWGDVAWVKTAILELVRNAFEADPQGGPVTIAVTAEESLGSRSAAQQPIRWVTLAVRDSGPGVPAEMEEKIFAPFYTTKTGQHAAGLGLTVALGFAQQLGGTIRYRSQPGATCFELLLPSRTCSL